MVCCASEDRDQPCGPFAARRWKTHTHSTVSVLSRAVPCSRARAGDGLSDGAEINKYGTDPGRADSDGDGLSDGEEIKVCKTDPRSTDSDGDGISDFDEAKK